MTNQILVKTLPSGEKQVLCARCQAEISVEKTMKGVYFGSPKRREHVCKFPVVGHGSK